MYANVKTMIAGNKRTLSKTVILCFVREGEEGEPIAEWKTSLNNVSTVFDKNSWILELIAGKLHSADKYQRVFQCTSLKSMTKSNRNEEDDESPDDALIPITVEDAYSDRVVCNVVNHLNGFTKDTANALAESEIVSSILLAHFSRVKV